MASGTACRFTRKTCVEKGGVMNQKTLHISGLRTPRLFVILRGFLDGKVTKKACINPRSGLLESAFISRKIFLYNEACRNCAINLEKEINSARLEAATLLTERQLNRLHNELLDGSSLRGHCVSDAYTEHTGTGSDSGSEMSREETDASPVFPHRASERRSHPVTAEEARAARKEAKEAARRADARAHRREKQERTKAALEEAAGKQDESMIRLTRIRERMISEELLAEESLAAASEAMRALLCAYAHGAVRGPATDGCIPTITYEGWLDEYRKAHEDLDHRISEALQQISC